MSREDHNGRRQPENLEGRFDEHIDETNLILYLDRELRPDESARVSSHLERCAECRQIEAGLVQASLAFSSFQRDFNEALPAPPGNWVGFEQRLSGVLAEQSAPREPWWKIVWNAWRKWLPGAPVLPWGLATGAAGLLVVFLWLHSPAYPTLSVNDIVSQVEQKRTTSVSTLRPVVYRKLRISVSAAPNLPVTVELWKRTSDGRVKELQAGQFAVGHVRRQAKHSASRAESANRNAAAESDSGLLDQVNAIYSANHLDWSEPVSATEFKKWAASDGPKEEQVVRESLPSGGEAYRLIVRAKNPLNSPQRDLLSEMQLLVRSSDWHAIAERLTLQGPSGVRTYEVAELDYRELRLNEVPASIFGAMSAGTALAGDLPRATLGIQPLSGAALAVEVLKRLDALDALAKDQVEVSRVGAEGLKLEGTIASAERKAEILAALGPLASNPALQLDLLSPSEVQDRASRSASRPGPVQSIQVPLDAQVSNPRLRAWLTERRGLSGAQLDAEAERFQMEAVVLSSDAQLQTQALKHILAVAPAAPAEGEAAQEWRSLVNRHAETVHQQIQALQQQLAPVFRTASAPRVSDDSKAPGSDDLRAGTDRLLDLVTATDHALWQAFSRSSTDTDQHQLTDPKFWLMLEEEDSLAADLMRRTRP